MQPVAIVNIINTLIAERDELNAAIKTLKGIIADEPRWTMRRMIADIARKNKVSQAIHISEVVAKRAAKNTAAPKKRTVSANARKKEMAEAVRAAKRVLASDIMTGDDNEYTHY